MTTQKENQLQRQVQDLAKHSKVAKRLMPFEKRVERVEDLLTGILEVLLKTLLVPR